MASGTQGSPSFWLPLQHAGVLEPTIEQGPAVGTGLLGCAAFIVLCHIHRPLLYLLLHCPRSSRQARAEVLAPHLGFSFSGDIQDLPGQGPVRPAVGDPASAGDLD